MSTTPEPRTPLPPTTRPEPRSDLLLGFIEYALAALLLLALLVAPIASALLDSSEDGGGVGAEDAAAGVFFIFFFTLAFQAAQGSYPWVFSRRRGRTIEADWRFISHLPRDLFVGLGMAGLCFLGAQVATVATGLAVGLDDTDSASNTDILLDNEGSPWLIGVIFLVVVGAPLAEELLFRGFVLRMLEKWAGSVFAIIVSSVLFAIPHWQPGATWQQTTVLLTALGVVGLILAIGTVITDRLGPAVIAHFLFNMTGTILALFL